LATDGSLDFSINYPAMLSHQMDGVFGAWLGGLAVRRFGDYT
jgi:hypothetical protein